MVNLNYTIPKNIRKVRIDVGMSSTGPNAAYWLNKYDDIVVIGIEPNPINFKRIMDGKFIVGGEIQIIADENIIKIGNGDVLCNYIEKGNYFIPIEAAIDNVNKLTKKTFYCTDIVNTGCSSLHKPIDERLNGTKTESEILVDVLSLEMLFENFPFEQIPVIEFLKTDTQSNDLNVVKSCGKFLSRVCFIFSEYYAHSAYEGEKSQYQCMLEFDSFMKENKFKQFYCSGTDIGYVNEKLIPYIIDNSILNDCIEFQNGINYALNKHMIKNFIKNLLKK
jgi:hypothetical protein